MREKAGKWQIKGGYNKIKFQNLILGVFGIFDCFKLD